MNQQQEHVLKLLENHGVKIIRLWFSDVLGSLKSVSVPPAEIEKAFSEGLGFDGSSVEGFTRIHESDLLAVPDASTFRLFPERYAQGLGSELYDRGSSSAEEGEHSAPERGARMFCDILTPDLQPAPTDSRNILKKQMERARAAGFGFFAHPEVEFYLLREQPGGELVPVDEAGYFDTPSGGIAEQVRRRSVELLEKLGIPVELSHHEAGPGQYEIDLHHGDALACADDIITLRAVVRGVASELGCTATFMPKPFAEHPPSGMHTHFSLFSGDRNIFYSPSGPYQLSPLAQQFVAGLLRHAPEISAVCNQSVNSYKRLWARGEAPNVVCWGHNNRSALVGVPLYKPNKASSCRIEYRALDAIANPYLAFALLLAAGMRGVEEGYELAPESEENVWELRHLELRALGLRQLPRNLDGALDRMEESELVAEVLGEQVRRHLLANKRYEWQEYRKQVTSWERDLNLKFP